MGRQTKEEPVSDAEEAGNGSPPEEKEEILFQGGATQQWAGRGCFQQEQELQEQEEAPEVIPGRLDWTFTWRGITHKTVPNPSLISQ